MIELVSQIIRALNAVTKFVAKISNMLEKDFVYLDLNK